MWVLLTPVTGWLLTLAAIVLWAERDASAKADVIVVLGAAQYDGRPSPVLKARLDHAVQLYKAGMAPKLLFTGGRRAGDAVSEAVAGQRYSLKQGVPVTAIMLESTSRTTLASIRGTALLLRPDTSAQSPRVLLVSDPFHMLRLTVLARMYGLTPMPSPTRTSPISARQSVTIEYIVRESFALPADVATVAWERMSSN
ncbi:MAG: YdcF family protein [Gemmatimonadaceae bacterium]